MNLTWKSKTVRIVTYIAAGYVAVAAVLIVGGIDSFTEVAKEQTGLADTPAPPEPVKPAEPEKTAIETGKDMKVFHSVSAAVDDAAWDSMMEAIRAKDRIGLIQLAGQGKVFMVNAGETVKVLDIGFTSVKVRTVEGLTAGRSGWIVREALAP